jgi:hypothetical protein
MLAMMIGKRHRIATAGLISRCVFLLAVASGLLKVAKPRNHMKRIVVSLLFLTALSFWSQAAEPGGGTAPGFYSFGPQDAWAGPA